MAFCSGCGATLPDGATFCAACGRSAVSGSATGAAAAPAPAAAGGLTDNIAGALAYVTIVPAIVFLLIEPYNRNKFIRFHAFQSIFYCVAWIVVVIGLSIIPFMGVLRMMLYPIIWLGFFVLWIVLVLKAYQGQKFKAPVIGDLAEKQA